MKLQGSTYKAYGSGMTDVSEFRMEMNDKAARILSDTLYTDKFGAIVRELSCNAFDAHIEAGKADVPFHITLPDAFNPQLRIRDYGPGISPEDIKDIYCVYFGSTKDDSNEGVGAFGLGSKTPFAYTDAFMVTSIHEGVKRIYSVYMSEGKPSISLCSKEETDEPSGLEVVITVERGDFQNFQNAVVKQLRFFPVKPDLNVNIDWPEIDETVLTVDTFEYFTTNDKNLKGFFIKQGPVAYPVDFEVLNDYYKNKLNQNVPELIKHLARISERYGFYGRKLSGAVLDMPIGTIEVTPSREGISYKEPTLNNIVNALENVSKKLFNTVEQNLIAAYNKSYRSFINYFNSLESFMREAADREYIEKNFKPFTIQSNRELGVLMDEKFIGIDILHYSNNNPSKPKRMKVVETGNWNAERDIYHNLIVDFKQSSIYRNALYFLVRGDAVSIKDESYAFLQRSFDAVSSQRFVIIGGKNCSDKTLKEFAKFAENFVDVVYVSDVPKPSRVSGHSTTAGKKRAWFEFPVKAIRNVNFNQYIFDNTLYAQRFPEEFNETIKDYQGDTLLYVTTHGNKLMRPDDSELNAMYLFILAHASIFNSMDIVAIPKGDAAKAERSDHFISLEEYYKKNRSAIMNKINDELNDVFLKRYNQRCKNIRFFIDVIRTHYGDEMEGIDDIPWSLASDSDCDLINIMHQRRFMNVMHEINRKDLVRKFEICNTLMDDSNSIDTVESEMKRLNIDFVSISKALSQLNDVFMRPENMKHVLKLAMRGFDDYPLYVSDPWNQKVLFDVRDVADEIIENIS